MVIFCCADKAHSNKEKGKIFSDFGFIKVIAFTTSYLTLFTSI